MHLSQGGSRGAESEPPPPPPVRLGCSWPHHLPTACAIALVSCQGSGCQFVHGRPHHMARTTD